MYGWKLGTITKPMRKKIRSSGDVVLKKNVKDTIQA